jgi:hypothetical protein
MIDELIREGVEPLFDARTDQKYYNSWLKDFVRRFGEFKKGGKIK